ncbi:Protein-tyrosine phosphatase [Macleaya cordata]|uniref:Protein-tyrosine phosphatase n=1 Tax=Macleaya cordata TaxID=56857 RepID=A0A200PPC5_MACCD|nr:Protein-tyrosine phosphatase [Macleaya cordata]
MPVLFHNVAIAYGDFHMQEPLVTVSKDTITEALKVLLDVRNHPILIHCRHGKNWCLPSVLEEYQRFAGAKASASATDMKFIENYDISCLSQCLYSIIKSRSGLLPASQPVVVSRLYSLRQHRSIGKNSIVSPIHRAPKRFCRGSPAPRQHATDV